jgi:hypothetical protein
MKSLFVALALAAQPVAVSGLHADAPRDAGDMATALAASGLPIADIQVLTSKTDPNKLLGRPGQYTSKVFFFDSRYPAGANDVLSGENTIEGFATIAEAKRRAAYIIKITSGSPMFAQYVYHRGRFVLRLDKALDPDEATAYDEALAKIVTQRL